MRDVTAKDDHLLTYLRGQWEQPLRLTTLEQGMLACGQATDVTRRRRLGEYLLAHPEIHPAVERWGARTLILTEDEKLLGRHLVQHAVDGRGQTTRAAAAASTSRSGTRVERGLELLEHLGLVETHRTGGAIAYVVAPNWTELMGPLAFTFHTVQRGGRERFNVP
jgi:hypothetical protein